MSDNGTHVTEKICKERRDGITKQVDCLFTKHESCSHVTEKVCDDKMTDVVKEIRATRNLVVVNILLAILFLLVKAHI